MPLTKIGAPEKGGDYSEMIEAVLSLRCLETLIVETVTTVAYFWSLLHKTPKETLLISQSISLFTVQNPKWLQPHGPQ